jgi:protocatechuate 3,4-dioxygenase beta subunit
LKRRSRSRRTGRTRGGRGQGSIDETRFLRGIQITNRQGIAEFATVYPGWYAGRTIHIHLKVRLGGSAGAERYAGGHVSHTGQLFLPEDITEQIAKMDPYVKHSNVHRTLHSEDNIFRRQGGAQSMLDLERQQKVPMRRLHCRRRPCRGSGSNTCRFQDVASSFYKQASRDGV